MDNDEMLLAMKDMFENLEKKFEKKVEEIKIHTGVLVEKVESDIKALAEGQEILNKKLDTTKAEFNNRMDRIDTNMDIVKDYIIKVDDKLHEHEIILRRVK